jgi:transposase-like protein
MPRGIPHSAELRAQVVAAILAGTTVAQAARQFKLSKQTVSRWAAEPSVGTIGTDQRARASAEDLGDRILQLIDQHLETIRAQLSFAARAEWLEKQPAAELAQLVAVERDTALRLLAGLRPAESSGGHDALGDGSPNTVDATS